MQHCSIRILLWRTNSRIIFMLLKQLSFEWMVIFRCAGCILLTMTLGKIRWSIISEKSNSILVVGSVIYEFNRTMASVIIVCVASTEGRNMTDSCGSATSHGGQTWRNILIFSFKAIRWLIEVSIAVGWLVVFSLNNKIFTLNITVSLLLKFNDIGKLIK